MKKKPLKVKQYSSVIETQVGKLGLVIANKKLLKIGFLSRSNPLIAPQDFVARNIVCTIKKYFSTPGYKFGRKLPIDPHGTPLQQKIWRTLLKIPYGKTITYGELAHKLRTSPRVIGSACRRNPIPIVIPCHRVVAAMGIGGFCGKISGNLLKTKKWLLLHESKR